MAQISSIRSLPDPVSNTLTAALKNGSNTPAKKPVSDETQASPLQAQLTHFSAVLTSLQNTTSTARSQYTHAYNQVRSGTYTIDSLDVSKSIVSDSLTKE